MKFSLISTLALAASVASAPTAQPDNQQSVDNCQNIFINKDISALSDQLKTLGDEANNININQIIKLLTLQNTATALGNTIQQATNDAKKYCPQLTDVNQALNLAKPLLALPPTINTTITAIINKKSTFDRAVLWFLSLSWLVKADLVSLHSKTQDLEAVLRTLFPATLSGIVNTTINAIETPFNNALAAYKSTPLITL